MKCPHCDYENDGYERADQPEGPFYRLLDEDEVRMRRPTGAFWTDVVDLYGCPRCRKVFVE